jgi:phage baseplate assembly protein gpV
MQQAIFQNRIDQQTISAENQIITFELPRQLDYESFLLSFNVALNITTAYTALRAQSVYGLVRRIELIANGQTVLEQIGGFEMQYINGAYRRNNPASQILTTTNGGVVLPSVAIGVTTAAFSIPVDRAMFDMARPKDTNLASRDLATIQLRVTLGALTDVFTGAGVATITPATSFIRLDSSSVQEYPSAEGKMTVPPFLLKRTSQDVPINASNPNLQVRLPVGNIMRAVHVVQRTTGDLTASLLNNLQIVRGSDVRFNLPYLSIARQTALQTSGANFIVTPGFFGASIDFARRGQRLGKVTDCWNLAGAADVYLNMDVTATGTGPIVTVVTEELIPRAVRS